MAGGSPGAASRPFSPLFVLGLLAVGLALGGHRGAQGERGAGRSGTSSNMAAAASARGGACLGYWGDCCEGDPAALP